MIRPGFARAMAFGAAIGLAVSAWGIRLILADSAGSGTVMCILFGFGLMFAVTGFRVGRATESSRLNRLARASAVALTVVVAGVAGEIGFRLIDHDFSGQRAAFLATPIFYRAPTVPTGDVFFRRPGPDAWRGPVLSTMLRQRGGLDAAYTGEQPVTVRYDSEGFRNPEAMTAWDMVVVGDSTVELGYLDEDDLFTSLIARDTGRQVKNLGVSWSGPFAHRHYLNVYGRAPGVRDAILVFFEGNDLNDMLDEAEALHRFQTAGVRPVRAIETQPSLVKAADAMIRRWRRTPAHSEEPPSGAPGSGAKAEMFANALFHSESGDVPVTLSFCPLAREDLLDRERELTEYALGRWAESARAMGMRPWLVYMPCKHRVLHGHLRYLESIDSQLAAWEPTNLPRFIEQVCDALGMEFIDVLPDLRRETELGRLTFNPVFDTHVNALGSRIIANTIAREMANRPLRAPAEPGGSGRDPNTGGSRFDNRNGDVAGGPSSTGSTRIIPDE